MDQSGQDDERADALSGLFALLTAKLEDGAALAANGQAKVGDTALLDLARRIHKLTSECTTISDPPVGAKKRRAAERRLPAHGLCADLSL